jgi:hypothetical protein
MKIIVDNLVKRGFYLNCFSFKNVDFVLGCHGCHALLDERNILLHQFYLRLGFVDVPTIDQNDQIILVGKQF